MNNTDLNKNLVYYLIKIKIVNYNNLFLHFFYIGLIKRISSNKIIKINTKSHLLI